MIKEYMGFRGELNLNVRHVEDFTLVIYITPNEEIHIKAVMYYFNENDEYSKEII